MMLPSRLGCPLSLKTPNMGNTGLLPVASAIAPPVIPEAVPGGILERQPQGLGRGVATRCSGRRVSGKIGAKWLEIVLRARGGLTCRVD